MEQFGQEISLAEIFAFFLPPKEKYIKKSINKLYLKEILLYGKRFNSYTISCLMCIIKITYFSFKKQPFYLQ